MGLCPHPAGEGAQRHTGLIVGSFWDLLLASRPPEPALKLRRGPVPKGTKGTTQDSAV